MAEFIVGAVVMLVGVFFGYLIAYASYKQAQTQEYIHNNYTPVKEMLNQDETQKEV